MEQPHAVQPLKFMDGLEQPGLVQIPKEPETKACLWPSVVVTCGALSRQRARLPLVRSGRPCPRQLLRADADVAPQVHDRMTEQVYPEPLRSFAGAAAPGAVCTVPVLTQGRAALEAINAELGLAFDEQARPARAALA